jgi:hypothetical protein
MPPLAYGAIHRRRRRMSHARGGSSASHEAGSGTVISSQVPHDEGKRVVIVPFPNALAFYPRSTAPLKRGSPFL